MKNVSRLIKDIKEPIRPELLLQLSSSLENHMKQISSDHSFVSIGPFIFRSSKSIDAKEMKIIQCVYDEDPNTENEARVASLDGAYISRAEMKQHLNDNSWLNELIINYVVEYLCVRACDSSPNPKYWYLPTAFEVCLVYTFENSTHYN